MRISKITVFKRLKSLISYLEYSYFDYSLNEEQVDMYGKYYCFDGGVVFTELET